LANKLVFLRGVLCDEVPYDIVNQDVPDEAIITAFGMVPDIDCEAHFRRKIPRFASG
jgi:hypothetical protein